MLSLSIPAGAAMALLLGAMLIQGVPPGPTLITQHPDIFWGLIASMWVGNLMLLVLNLPLIGIWIKLLETPYRFIYPTIVVFCMVGIYNIRNEPFDIFICGVALAVGWILESLDCSPAPLILGMILGPILEENFRRSLLLSHGDPMVFLQRPISLGFLILTVALVVLFTWPALKRKEKAVVQAGGVNLED
jgi:putative tricarboxylic transport membrane protein